MRAVFLTLAGLAAVCAPSPASAGERDAAVLYFEAREAEIAKTAAKLFWKAAKAARDDALHWQCNDLCERILFLYPDHKGAREHLGWKRVKDRWVLDEAAASKVIRENTRKSGENVAKYWKRVGAWRKKYVDPAERELAKRFVKVGDTCKRRKYPLQALRAYHRAIYCDADDDEARRRLGREPLDGLWVPTRLSAAYAQLRGVDRAAPEPEWEAALGKPLRGRQTRHVRIVATSHESETEYMARAGELAYLITLDFLGLDLERDWLKGARMRFPVIDESHWRAWVRAFPREGQSESDAMNYGFLGSAERGVYANKRTERFDHHDIADFVAHEVSHIVLHRAYGPGQPPWVFEGLAQHVSALIAPTADSRCFSTASTRYGNADDRQRWEGSPQWRLLVRELVKSSDDLALRGLLDLPIERMNLETGVKAWSVLTWLYENDRKATKELLGTVKAKGDQVALLAKLYGKTPEELDAEWRAYVMRNY